MNPASRTQQPIRPTLYIGLGGTGKEVLLRLRRRFYERFRVRSLPCTQFLWIDTDTRECDARGEDLDAAMLAVGFRDPEKVPLLNGTVGDAAIDIFRNRQKWSYIHRWLYEEVERYGRGIADGAGGVRAVGRLMFMANFVNVQAAVKRAIMQLRQSEMLVNTKNFYRDRGLGEANMDPTGLPMVCVVSSVAGGTGAGILLDLTFLLRHLEDTVQKLHGVASYVFLPNVYYSDPNNGERASRSYGNAYAALKELDHFCQRDNSGSLEQGGGVGMDLDVTWQDKKPLTIVGPPVDVTYLLEMRNAAGISLAPSNRRELFSMLAESLYLDLLPGAFASAKRSDYSNIVLSLAGDAGVNSSTEGVNLPQTFSRRFATCGLSKIEVPQDMIRAACAARLGADIVGTYILRELPDQSVGMDIRNDMARASLDRDGIPSLFGTEWRDIIAAAVEDVFRRSAIKLAADVDEIGGKLENLEKKLTYSLYDDKVKWGDVVKNLRNQGGPATDAAKKRADELLRERALENPARGVSTSMRDGGYLDECIAALRALGAPEEAGTPAVFGESQAESARDAERNKDARRELLNELKGALSGISIKVLGASEWTINILTQKLRESATQVLLCQAEACLFAEANKTALAVAQHLEQVKKTLGAFVDFAKGYADGRANDAESLQQVETTTQVLIFRLYDKAQHWNDFYRLDHETDNGKALPVNPEKEYRRFASGVGAGVGILEFAAALNVEGGEALSKKLDEFCEERFAEDFRINRRAVDVLEHPLMKNRLQEYLQLLVNAALPMLRQNQRLGVTTAEIEHTVYLGVANKNLPKYAKLATDIGNLLQARLGPGYVLEAHSTDNPSEIYLYLSDYAFSLPLLPIVEHDAHTTYWDFYDKINQTGAGNAQQLIPLHLSKQWEGKLEDLVVYNDEQANTVREIISIVLFGHMLKVLLLKEQKGLHSYFYMLGQPFSRPESIGPRRQVAASLLKDSELRKILGAAIRETENKLFADEQLLLAYHRAVQAAANSPDLIRNTPDDIILGKKLNEIQGHGGASLKQDLDRITKIDHTLRYEYLRKLNDSGIDWVLDTYPTVRDVPAWEYPVER